MSHHKQTRHIVDSKVGCCLPSHVLKKPFVLLCLEPCLLLTQQCQAGYRWGRETFYPHTTHIQGYRVGWLWWQEYLKVKTMSASASRCFYAGKNSQLKCHTFMMSHIYDVTIVMLGGFIRFSVLKRRNRCLGSEHVHDENEWKFNSVESYLHIELLPSLQAWSLKPSDCS